MKVLLKFFSLLTVLLCILPANGAGEELPEMKLIYKSNIEIRVIYQKAEWQKLIGELQQELNKEESKDPFIPLPESLALELIILDPQTFIEKTNAPEWVNPFFYKGKIYLRVSDANTNPQLIAKSLKHEIVHAIISYWAGEAAPFWFDEGLAKWQEGALTNLDILNFRDFYRRQSYIELQELNLSFATMPKDKALAAYVQAALAIDYLHKTFGDGIIKKILSTLKNQPDFEKALLSLTGLSYQALDERLKKYIKSWLNQNRSLY